MWITDYQPEQYGQSFDVADGDHKIRIKEAKVEQTSNKKNMIVVVYYVQGSNNVPFTDRIVEGDYFNQNMTRFFDAFKIQHGNFNFGTWIGKEATARFEHRVNTFTDKNGMQRTVNRAELVKMYTPEVATPTAPSTPAEPPVKANGDIW